MKRLLAIFALLFIAALPQRIAADPADIGAAARGVVRVVIIAEDEDGVHLVGHGSGFAVSPTLIVTNAHVVEPIIGNPQMRIGVVPPQGKSGYFVKVVGFAPQRDLALLKLTEPGSLTPLALYSGPVSDGQEVWAVGYPANVDAAQGFGEADYMTPTAPVKTRGNISAGRVNKSFDALLHTAQIAAGNSGGPLLDGCGRVIGANSFGTQANTGADSEFYFAVSMREISRFLLESGAKVESTGEPCKSQAEFMSEEQRRLQAQQQADAERQVQDAARRDAALKVATRQAESDVIAARENHIALAGLALLAALASGGAAFWFAQKGDQQKKKGAAIAAAALALGAIGLWLTRPSLADIDKRAAEIAASDAPSSEPGASAVPLSADSGGGHYICVIDRTRSRITQSATTDVPLAWRADGCVNGKTQYALGSDGWSRILAPNSEDTVSVAAFDPATRTYTTRRYLLDAETMAKVRDARGKYTPPQCGGGEEAARRLGDAQAAILSLLPEQANERLVYNCSAAP